MDELPSWLSVENAAPGDVALALRAAIRRHEGTEWDAGSHLGDRLIYLLRGQSLWACAPEPEPDGSWLFSVQSASPSQDKGWVCLKERGDDTHAKIGGAEAWRAPLERLIRQVAQAVEPRVIRPEPAPPAAKETDNSAPSQEIQDRAGLFLEVLRANPAYRQEQVASAAAERHWQRQGGERPKWTKYTVQNDFRRMGWNWKEEQERASLGR